MPEAIDREGLRGRLAQDAWLVVLPAAEYAFAHLPVPLTFR